MKTTIIRIKTTVMIAAAAFVSAVHLLAAPAYDDFSTDPNIGTGWTEYSYHGTENVTPTWDGTGQDLDLAGGGGSGNLLGIYRTGSSRSATDSVTLTIKDATATGGTWGQVGLMISSVAQPGLLDSNARYELELRWNGGTSWYYLVRKDVGTGSYDLFTSSAFTFSGPVTLEIVRNGDHYDFKANGSTLYTASSYTSAVHDTLVNYQITFGGDSTMTATVDDFGAFPLETIPPTLADSDIVDDKSGGSVEANTLVTYTVTFSEDMDASTVSDDDFGNAGTSTVAIGTVTETAPGVFTVPVSPGSAGSLQLQVDAGAVLKDLAGNLLVTTSAIVDDTSITVIADTTAPTLTGIADNQGGGSVGVNTPVTYTVSFSEDMDASTISAADFSTITTIGSATATIGTVTETAPYSGVFTVPVTPTSTGTLQPQVNAGAELRDLAGFGVDTGSAIIDDTIITVIADNTAPTLAGADIVDNMSGGPVDMNALVTYTVTFSEDMEAATVSAADFGNAGTARIDIGVVTETAPGVFTVPVTPTSTGTIQLQVNAGANLQDLSGHPVDTTSDITDDTTLNITVPTVNWQSMMTIAPRQHDTEGNLLPLQSYDETIRRGMSFLLDDHLAWFNGPPTTLVDEQGDTQMPWVYYSNLQQDGTPFPNSVDRFVSYPAFHHSLLIQTFLGYWAYNRDARALTQAIKLADWNIANSTPGDWAYGNLPYSTFQEQQPGGFRDGAGLMPDKAAIMALSYLDLFDVTGEPRFLAAAEAIGHTLSQRQRATGTWPFRVHPETEAVIEEYSSSVIYAVMLFEELDERNGNQDYEANRDLTLAWLLNGPVLTKDFRGFYEDIAEGASNRTNWDCIDTVNYLLAKRTDTNGYLAIAQDLNTWIENTFMDNIGGFEPAQGIREQLAVNVVMGIHSMHWASMLVQLAEASGDDAMRQRAIQTANYITYYLQPDNRIPVGFQYNQWWYSCHTGVVLYLFDFVKNATFNEWIGRFEAGELTGFDDDFDRDGLANGLEAWFGTHPGLANRGLTNSTTNGLITTFTHPQNANPPSDLTGYYQWSPNLRDWYAGDGIDGPGGGPTVTITPNTVGTTTTVTVTPSGTMDRLFLRAGVMQD